MEKLYREYLLVWDVEREREVCYLTRLAITKIKYVYGPLVEGY